MSAEPVKRINLLGRRHKVAWVDDIDDFGTYDYMQLEIQVNPTHPLHHQQDTLWHEILHGVEAHYGLDLEDDIIDKLASGSLTVLQSNPQLVRWLLKKDAS